MLNLVIYYKDVETLSLDVGDYVRIHALYDDIEHGTPTAPNSIMLLANNYDGDLEKLKHNHDRIAKKALLDWIPIREMLKANEVYDAADAAVFLNRLQIRNGDSDFRDFVRQWSRAELKKIADGKEAKFYGPTEFLKRYENLLITRKKREEKKRSRY